MREVKPELTRADLVAIPILIAIRVVVVIASVVDSVSVVGVMFLVFLVLVMRVGGLIDVAAVR